MSKLNLMQEKVYGNITAMFLSDTQDLSWWEAYKHLTEGESTELITVAEAYEDWPLNVLVETINDMASTQVALIKELLDYAKADMVAKACEGMFDAFDMNTLDLKQHIEEGIKAIEKS